MKLTPLDIQQQQFKTRFRGFDVHEVDVFLERMADTFESLIAESEGLRERISKLEAENQGYKKREESFKRAMLNAQRVIDDMKENAQKSAELTIAEAEVKAEKILNGAHNRLAQLHEDIAEMKRQRMQIEVQIRAVLEVHTKLLDIGKEETKTADDADSQLKVFKKA